MVSSISAWRVGAVDCDCGCLAIQYGTPAGSSDRDWIPVALVGPPSSGVVTVEFLVERKRAAFAEACAAVEKEIQFYLVDKGETDAWGYVSSYHIGALANEYGPVQWGWLPDALQVATFRFRALLRTHTLRQPYHFSVSELKDPNWPWGYAHGVYCFSDADGIAYVGRALSKTLGERIADHLRSTDPQWQSFLQGDSARVDVLDVDEESICVASALEAYLIGQLAPRINRHRQ
jgi:hypothetical protein